ncbi:MAG: lipopolysaccharide biosynthesis protein [Lachnospiraceae bacterium]|nr:lipopolysaccharide biosynthesis protein [Lachnospiraceae bacterium]
MSEQSQIKTSVIAGFFWKAMESGGDQLITFFISVILARLLGPEKYGTMAIMLIFIAIAQVIIQNGFQTALIQKKEIGDEDLSSVFWVGLLISTVLYLLIFAASPFIARFFGDPEIIPMLRVLSLILFSGSVVSVEIAIIARQMNFRLQCIGTIIADLFSGVIGILAAFQGMGTWALVLQQLIKNVCLMIFLLWKLGWRPQRMISVKSISSLFSYGWKVLASGLIDTIYSNLYTPFISRLYNATMVGYYNRANQFPQVIVNSMAQTLQAVMLPAFSRTQDEQARGRLMLRRTIKMAGFVMFPAMFGIAAVAEAMIRMLLGEVWLPAVPLLRLCALSFSVWHMHVANLQAINANGRSDIYLKLEIIKKAAGVAVLLGSVRFGVTGMILMKAVWDYVCTFINGWPNRSILDYGPSAQWRDSLPEFTAAALMGVAVYGLQILLSRTGIIVMTSGGQALIMILIQVAAGALLYLVIAVAFRMESLRYLIETAKLYLHH